MTTGLALIITGAAVILFPFVPRIYKDIVLRSAKCPLPQGGGNVTYPPCIYNGVDVSPQLTSAISFSFWGAISVPLGAALVVVGGIYVAARIFNLLFHCIPENPCGFHVAFGKTVATWTSEESKAPVKPAGPEIGKSQDKNSENQQTKQSSKIGGR